MPWWAWILVVGFALFFLLTAGMGLLAFRLRRLVQTEFMAYLNQAWPEVTITGQKHMLLEIRLPDGVTGEIDLAPMYRTVLAFRAGTPDQRRLIYAEFLENFRKGQMTGTAPADVQQAMDRILPRLVTAEFFSSHEDLADLPRLPLGGTGLFIVCVLDSEESVMYLGAEHLKSLEISEAQALEKALENLRKSFDARDRVRGAIEKREVVSVYLQDSFDAARLLLLPECLNEGEALLAAVPDLDTLVFTNADGADAREFEKAAQAEAAEDADQPLLKRLVRVTSDGVELA